MSNSKNKNAISQFPTIEIPVKEGSFCFPLAEFSKNKFMLTSIDVYLQLQEAITIWINENQKTTYDEYQALIQDYSSNIPTDDDNKRESISKPNTSATKKKKTSVKKSPQKLNSDDEDILIHTQVSPNMKHFSSLYEYQNGDMLRPSQKKYFKKPRYHSKTGTLYNVMTKINTRNKNSPDFNKTQDFYNSTGKPAIQISTTAMKKSLSKKDRLTTPNNIFGQRTQTDNISTNSLTSHKLSTSKGSHVNSVIRNSLVNFKGNPMVSNYGVSRSSENIYLQNDCLFLSDNLGKMEEWSISKRQIHKDWGQIHKDNIRALKMSPCGSILLTADNSGHLKQWSVTTRRLVWDYGKVHKGWVGTISITPNSLYAFTGGEYGNLKQWALSHTRLWKEYDGLTKDSIYSTDITNDGKFLFIASGENGNIKMMNILDRTLEKEFNKAHRGKIMAMKSTRDSRFLFTTAEDGFLKQWSIVDRKQFMNYNRIHTDWVSQINLTSEYLITTTGNWGYVKLFKFSVISDNEHKTSEKNLPMFKADLLFDFGRQMVGGVQSLAIENDGRTMFLSGTAGNFTQYDLESKSLVKEHVNFKTGSLRLCSILS